MKLTRFFYATGIPALVLAATVARADLIVNRSIIIYDDPDVSKEDVVVFNSDETDNLYLNVEPYRVQRPGEAEQSLVPLSPKDGLEFLASPNRLIVPPQSRSIVRMLDLQTGGDRERVYRVNIIPVSAEQEWGKVPGETIESRLSILVAYQVLAIVLPDDPHVSVDVDRAGRSARFRNSGNANYLLTDGEQCNPLDSTECVVLSDRRIYPGNNWETELPFDGPFQYKVRTHEGLTSVVFE
jgi:P pilus assembly chaperone PapD